MVKSIFVFVICQLFIHHQLSASEELSATEVTTSYGIVVGIIEGDARQYRGIPYTQAPLGEFRWQPPRPPLVWQGIKQAINFGSDCPQAYSSNTKTTKSSSEDCLTLNISTPKNIPTDSKLPVLVWIHGGGLVAGSGSSPIFGNRVWTDNNIIFVSFNYRLGALGFFAHPALDNRLGANFGLMDMVAVLKWLKQNIKAFGGDSEQLTIMGVSAGAMGVQLLMVTPEAKGLFNRAISQSGYGTWPKPRIKTVAKMDDSPSAESIATVLINKISYKTNTAAINKADLLKIPATDLVNAVEGFHLPIVDGITLPEESALMFARGLQHPVAFMSGGNSFDGSVFPLANLSNESVLMLLGDRQKQARELYKNDFKVSELRGISSLFGDMRYVFSSYYMTQQMEKIGQPGYLYLFAPSSGEANHATASLKIFNSDSKKIKKMRQYWMNFIKNGTPNDGNLTRWPKQKSGKNQWMVFNEEPVIKDAILKNKLDFLHRSYLQRISSLKLNLEQ